MKKIEYVIGDIRDKDALSFSKNIDVVIHAAAIKHVSFCEDNPLEAVKTNVLGTQIFWIYVLSINLSIC